MKYIIYLILFLFPFKAIPSQPIILYYSSNEKTIYKKILRINPRLKKIYTFNLTLAINKASIKYKLNSKKLIAIFAQESMFNIKAINKTHDYSIGQINIANILNYKFDKYKLMNNVYYSVDCSALLLSKLYKKYGKNDPNWWTRYHSNNKEQRIKYKKLVSRYL